MHGVDRRVVLLILALISAVFTTCSIGIRIWVRCRQKIFLRSDNYLILAAQLSFYAIIVCVVLQASKEGHRGQIPHQSALIVFRKSFLALQILYGLAQGFIKLSTCSLYLHLFGRPLTSLRRLLLLVMALALSWSFSIIMFSFFMCRPLSSNWHPGTKGNSCVDRPTAFVIFGIFDILVDLLLITLATFTVGRLTMPTKKKIEVISLFCQAVLTIPISIIRTKSLTSVDYNDITSTATIAILTSLLEPAIGIITACTPTMNVVFQKSLSDRWVNTSLSKSESGSVERVYDYEYKYPRKLEDGATFSIIFSHRP